MIRKIEYLPTAGKPVHTTLATLALISAGVMLSAHAQANSNLTQGAVFAMSNDRAGNVVVAYQRHADGSLEEVGRSDTGGSGSGSFEDSANGLILTTVVGEIAPNNLVEPSDQDQQFLLATNAGSNSITVFAVREEGLERVDVEDSNGEKPVSVTVNNGLVYVLNSGETNDALFDDDGNVIDNCTTGEKPTITGFRLDVQGQLTPINGSTRRLSGEQISGCAQVSFDPSGSMLVVTERLAQPKALRQQTSDVDERLDDEGVINTFVVGRNGSLQRQRAFDATGQGPFGFTFSKEGVLLVTEQFDGPGGPGRGGASSYLLNVDGWQDNSEGSSHNSGHSRGALLRSSPSVPNGGTDTCWFVTTDDQTLGFATSFFGDGRISSYELDGIGIVRLIDAVASGENAMNDDVAVGASDLALSRDSQYLYQLNSVNGTVSAFRNNGDGTLTLIDMETPFPQPVFGPGSGEAAPTGLAAS